MTDFDDFGSLSGHDATSNSQVSPYQFGENSPDKRAEQWQRAANDAGLNLDADRQPNRGMAEGGIKTTPQDSPQPGAAAIEPIEMKAVEDSFTPSKEGFHQYQSGPDVICPAALRCSPQEIANQMSRFAVPGQDPSVPVVSGQKYPVYAPGTGTFVGSVRTKLSDDGLISQNTTLPGHLLYNGEITRTASQGEDGSWSVTTIGRGNNIWPGMAAANQIAGPEIFSNVDMLMKQNIARHHGLQ